LDLAKVVPSVAGPKRPQDRIELPRLGHEFEIAFCRPTSENGFGKPVADLHRTVHVEGGGWTRAASGGGKQDTVPLVGDVKNTNQTTEREMANNRPTPTP